MEQDKIYLGNNLDILKTFPDNSIDSIVTDPPYGINFMNKHWDYDVPRVELWKECLRVLKHGGHILVACGTRTQHRMAVNIEDAGFEIRDIIAWVYGSGFPKSLSVEKAIESHIKNGKSNPKALRKTEQEGNGKSYKLKGRNNGIMGKPREYDRKEFASTTEQAKQWQGWGTALKPSMELWTLARKPLKGTVAQNVLEYGVGGLNIDGCRVDFVSEEDKKGSLVGFKSGEIQNTNINFNASPLIKANNVSEITKGRFPANLIIDNSEEVVALFPETQPSSSGGISSGRNFGQNYDDESIKKLQRTGHDDNGGSASRFFYTAKASASERNMGLYDMPYTTVDDGRDKSIDNPFQRGETPRKNIHPTVKPLDLMRYLCRLITPKGGLVLDPFIGSGTTGIAAKQEKMHYIGIEIDEQYLAIAEARIKSAVIEYDIFDFMEEDEI